MRLELRIVRSASEGALMLAVAACTWGLLTERVWARDVATSSVCVAHFAAVYLVTTFSFAAFVRSRRTDLVRIVVLVAILGEIAQLVFGRAFDLFELASDIAGAFAVFVPSFMERFRSLVRSAPRETFAMVYPNDRRRRRSGRESVSVAKPA